MADKSKRNTSVWALATAQYQRFWRYLKSKAVPKNEIKFKVSARYIFDVDVIIPGNLKYCELSTGKQKNMSLSSENGASSRLTFLPLADFGFHMNKQHFIDAIYMRYDL